ncbi:peptidase M50 [Leptospira wolffii]|uniref:Peptidase M50 n=1 Tax=Leptospira wolffii TaxID=409998 RepID=A0A2M9ZEY6_9LEPT|nr:site-2 protease family protein [Leptospira wolffii]PJZ66942.1 peptidase M50 [Leptospira wolffii]
MNRPRYGLHLFLFILTFLTLTFQGDLLYLPGKRWEEVMRILLVQWPYSVSLLLILLCHEMGHYTAARYYGIRATLPFFIPMPMSPVGTMGAVIKILEPIRNKIQLFDIGIWGPAMSLFLSLPCLWIGLHFSTLESISDQVAQLAADSDRAGLRLGNSLLVYWSSQKILGPFDSALYTVDYHPLAFAGWVGLLVTALNLLPFGQLDGGHIIYSLAGERYRKWIYYLFSLFLSLSIWNYSWIFWGLIIYYFIRVEHPYVPDSPIPMDKYRKYFGWAMLLSLVFIFPISPFEVVTNFGVQSSLGEDIWSTMKSLFDI